MADVNKLEFLKEDKNNSFKIKKFLINHSVTLLFVVICMIAIYISKLSPFYIINELLTRITRNSFLVLSLIIPVLAGMGLNFGITIGAMAGQIAIIAIAHWKIGGIWGFLLCIVLSTPIAVLFGNLTGKLLNKTKGQEMIASMIAGFFANGLYQFLFLFLIGTLIPMKNPELILSRGIGIRNTVDLSRNNGIMYALDNLLKLPLFNVLIVGFIIALAYSLYKIFKSNSAKENKKGKIRYIIIAVLSVVVIVFSFVLVSFNQYIPNNNIRMLKNLKLPVVTAIVIFLLCMFNNVILKTKLGQDFRTVGQDMHIAEVSGINVDKVRILAITISTLLAAWGQIIFLQNIGTLNTYGSHVQIGLFSIAALLVGGASVTKATVGQGLLGIILFHTLFIVSPQAGKNLFGDAQIGEYFRAFVAYGVIGISLGLHAWKKTFGKKY
ncbi:ABC transporter permease subunit [Caminicella sporogenes]|uniref:ABC transporter permease subunit n=1 Tax=Caminicella sporogenes TaxID=166485 RepID=UPI00253FE90E|nr:ABC transporter permease [Caminicella sporogenes]WIF94268.1 ABC transporter permease [Caminicella sporogenes]